jgi:hypothetical protein
MRDGAPRTGRGQTLDLPYIVIDAEVSTDLGAPWIATLQRVARGADTLKCRAVSDYVRTAVSQEATLLRDGLLTQTLVITDPLEVVRRIDLNVGTVPGGLMGTLLAARPADSRPETAALASALRDWMLDRTVDNSGAGHVANLIDAAESIEIDGDVKRRCRTGNSLREYLTNELAGSLTHATLLASKSTVLLAPVLDPEHPRHPRIEHWAAGFAEVCLGDSDPFAPRRTLVAVAGRRLLMDRGHENVRDLTAHVRHQAEWFSHPSWLRWDPAADADDEADADAGRIPYRAPGYVRSADDKQVLGLQVADVAAGYARWIAENRGFRELQRAARTLLYNGRPLTGDGAARLDRDIAEHRRVLTAKY